MVEHVNPTASATPAFVCQLSQALTAKFPLKPLSISAPQILAKTLANASSHLPPTPPLADAAPASQATFASTPTHALPAPASTPPPATPHSGLQSPISARVRPVSRASTAKSTPPPHARLKLAATPAPALSTPTPRRHTAPAPSSTQAPTVRPPIIPASPQMAYPSARTQPRALSTSAWRHTSNARADTALRAAFASRSSPPQD